MTRRAIFFLLAACSSEPGADFTLVPDPNVSQPEQVIAAVDSIVMTVDSAEGLYPPGSERSIGNVQIENADSDPELEVVTRIEMPLDRFPLVRLVQGTLPDVSLDLRFLGLPAEPGAPYVAVGRVGGVHLSPSIPMVSVPFNLRPERLPPRVAEVLPSDGSPIDGCTLERVYVMFSKPIEPATLASAITLSPMGSITDVRVDSSGLTAELVIASLIGDGNELAFRLEIATAVTDRQGNALDQVPADPGAQPFGADFVLSCQAMRKAPQGECGGVSGPLPNPCPHAPRLSCVEDRCVRTSCEGARCGEGLVCAPATSACELDCRTWPGSDGCPSERPNCDRASGVCLR